MLLLKEEPQGCHCSGDEKSRRTAAFSLPSRVRRVGDGSSLCEHRVALKRAFGFRCWAGCRLRPLTTDPVCQLDVLGRDGDAFGAQVGVLEEPHQVCLAHLLRDASSNS